MNFTKNFLIGSKITAGKRSNRGFYPEKRRDAVHLAGIFELLKCKETFLIKIPACAGMTTKQDSSEIFQFFPVESNAFLRPVKMVL